MKLLNLNHLPIVRNRLELQLHLNQTTRNLSTQNDEYQFLHKSNMPTYYFQKSLPRLPIPKPEKTLERYLAAQRPLLTDDEYEVTKGYCKKFMKAGMLQFDRIILEYKMYSFLGGWELQAMLKEKDKVNNHTSYISEPWFTMYLKDRSPLPVNYNPVLIMNHDSKPGYNDQILRTANIIISSLRFMKSLKAEILVPEIFHMSASKTDTETFRSKIMKFPTFIATYAAYFYKAYPLDMSQFQGLFGATRIPHRDKDVIYRNDKTKHIVVMKAGNFYTIDVMDSIGNICDPDVIYTQLKYLDAMEPAPAESPIGSLTTQNRRIWASARNHIISLSTKNADNMTMIDSALFCICLDATNFNDSNPVPTIRNFLFDECKNRWYDKSLSVIVDKDGTAAVNFEHSWGDGGTFYLVTHFSYLLKLYPFIFFTNIFSCCSSLFQ